MSNKLLTGEYPLIVLPALSRELGTNAAIVLQQIHYWSQKQCGKIIDGLRWIYNTYQQWQQQLPFLSISTIKRAIAKLRDLNLILIEQHDKSEWNHTNYYRIDYESLKALQLSIGSDCTDRSSQFEPIGQVNLNQSSLIPENTLETKTETPSIAALKNEISKTEITNKQIDECCTQISIVSKDVKLNFQVRSAIATYWANFPAALQRLKKAVREGWKCNLTGVLVKALKEGVPEDEVMPIVTDGWKEWVDKAIKRGLINGSSSEGSDLRIYFRDGREPRLWSEIKSLSWEELANV